MNFLNYDLVSADLRDCTLITKNGTKITVAIDSIESSVDDLPKFEGRIMGVKTTEPKLTYKDYSRYYKADHDVELDRIFYHILNSRYGIRTATMNYIPEIKNVIFNDPATIVFWDDGTKTVVKCQPGDSFDPEKGLAMAITKKAYGNKGSYCNQLKKWLPKSKKQKPKNKITFREEAAKKHPEHISACWMGGVFGCPRDKEGNCTVSATDKTCRACWDRVIPDELMDND